MKRITHTAALTTALVLGVGSATPSHAQDCDPAEVAKLLASDGEGNDQFGGAVSISGDTAIIGTHLDDDIGFNSGAAYIFVRSNGVWTEQAKLTASDGARDDWFGISVSLNGDTALIGSWFDEDHGFESGSAYIFTRDGDVWTQQAKLLPGDVGPHDRFGNSVSISGDTAVVGAYIDDDHPANPGKAYVFTRSGGVWTQQAKLLPIGGADTDNFGWSVSVGGNTLVISAIYDDNNGSNSGSAYVFTRSGSVWTQQAHLLPADGAANDLFGYSVALSGDTALIGAQRDIANGTNSGSAYIFARSGSEWTEQAKLLASDGAGNDRFGFDVSLSGPPGEEVALIGAYWDDNNGGNSGSAYVFTRSGSVWTEEAKFLPTDGAADDQFGHSVALSGDTAIIGAWFDDDNGTDSGSAYIFDLDNACPADLTGDCEVNTQDFLLFLGAWSLGDPLADWNDDGDINTQDFLSYLNDWVAGCS